VQCCLQSYLTSLIFSADDNRQVAREACTRDTAGSRALDWLLASKQPTRDNVHRHDHLLRAIAHCLVASRQTEHIRPDFVVCNSPDPNIRNGRWKSAFLQAVVQTEVSRLAGQWLFGAIATRDTHLSVGLFDAYMAYRSHVTADSLEERYITARLRAIHPTSPDVDLYIRSC
jgi:hypothetical protein